MSVLKLSVGEQVYVLGKGYGRVKLITDGGFEVDFEGYGTVHYNPDGTQGVSSIQRVFYDNPIVVEPICNQHLWRTYKHITRVVFEEIRRLDSLGELGD
jgi:hypothetical protein